MDETKPGSAIVVIILAVAVGLALVIFAGAAAWAIDSEKLNLTDAQLAFLTTTIGALIGALSTYLGVGRGAEVAHTSSASTHSIMTGTAGPATTETQSSPTTERDPSMMTRPASPRSASTNPADRGGSGP